jgi:REP-associated tyrosine transposase
MPRAARVAPGGVIFHVLNRANARSRIFEKEQDYEAFNRVIGETLERIAVRILAYSIMPNHWHMVLWPTRNGELGNFVQRLTTTHVLRWHLHRHSVGSGHLYQGTYKSFPIQDDEHFLTVCRYVEQNPLRAGLVQRAEDWRWSSLRASITGTSKQGDPVLAGWPVPKPADWVSFVNQALTIKELEELRLSAQRGRPFGNEGWKTRMAAQLGLESTMRPRGRPRKEK